MQIETTEKSKFQDLLAVSVAGGSSIRAASESAGCSESHAYELSRRDEFKQLVSKYRTEAIEQAIGRISGAIVKAASTLEDCLDCDSPTARIQAAKTLLSAWLPLTENLELRRRIEVMEQRALETE